MAAPTPVNLPIVDFSACSLDLAELDVSRADVKEVCKQIVTGFEDYGAIYLTNHGLQTKGLPGLRLVSRQFFELSKLEKLKSVRTQHDPKNGWVAEEMESFDPKNKMGDLKECYNLALCDIDQYPWPSDSVVPNFRAANRDFIHNINQLTRRLFSLLGAALVPHDPEVFARAHSQMETGPDNTTCLRNLYYAPLSKYPGVKPGQWRLSAHTDFGMFTLLFQDDTGGLEVQGKDGTWFEARPLEGAVMVQVADQLERWTAGRMKAAVHRVSIPHDLARQERVRESTTYFVTPDNDYVVRCLDGSDTYPPCSMRQYIPMKIGQIQDTDERVVEQITKS